MKKKRKKEDDKSALPGNARLVPSSHKTKKIRATPGIKKTELHNHNRPAISIRIHQTMRRCERLRKEVRLSSGGALMTIQREEMRS